MNNVGLEVVFWTILSLYLLTKLSFKKNEIILYNENFEHQGSFDIQKRNTCDRKYKPM